MKTINPFKKKKKIIDTKNIKQVRRKKLHFHMNLLKEIEKNFGKKGHPSIPQIIGGQKVNRRHSGPSHAKRGQPIFSPASFFTKSR